MLSIIIPSYRRYFYLRKALESCYRFLNDSLSNSNKKNSEIIVIDDGSGRMEQSKIASDPLFNNAICIFLPENVGVINARNIGACVAKNPVLWFLDSDNLAHPLDEINLLELCKYTNEKGICFFMNDDEAGNVIGLNYFNRKNSISYKDFLNEDIPEMSGFYRKDIYLNSYGSAGDYRRLEAIFFYRIMSQVREARLFHLVPRRYLTEGVPDRLSCNIQASETLWEVTYGRVQILLEHHQAMSLNTVVRYLAKITFGIIIVSGRVVFRYANRNSI